MSEAGKIGAAVTNNRVEQSEVAPNDATPKGKTSDFVAKKIGLSPRTYERAKQIIEKAPEELEKPYTT